MACKHMGALVVQLHSFLTSALDGGQRSTSLPGHFTSRKEPQSQLKAQCSEARFSIQVRMLSFQITRTNAHLYNKIHYDIHCCTNCGFFTVPTDVALSHHFNLIKPNYRKTKNS